MKHLVLSLLVACMAFGVQAQGQVDEAALVFEGKFADNARGGTWKVVVGEMDALEQRALAVLTERMTPYLLRDGRFSTSMVLPVEVLGGQRVQGKRDAIFLGVPGRNKALAHYVKPGEVPNGGYLVKTLHENGHNIAVLAGDGGREVLWAVFDFLDVCIPTLSRHSIPSNAHYAGEFFRLAKVPKYTRSTAPETAVRSVFSWGHVVDDLDETFRAMARARFTRAILWNDKPVINAKEVVERAHAWGIEVYWGFSWGWTLSGTKKEQVDFDALADGIVDEWRRVWRPMGGDGIYFQSFTETNLEKIAGKSIPEAVTKLVNAVAGRMRKETPGLDIVFGLHANSMHGADTMNWLAQIDPSIEILWENCGGFPYGGASWFQCQLDKRLSPDIAFNDQILALRPKTGLAWKSVLNLDWSHVVGPAGPFVLGHAGRKTLERDQSVIAYQHTFYDEDWFVNGKTAWELIRHLRAAKNPPVEFNTVSEYNPPYAYSTHCQAELFWNSTDSWESISQRARLRTRPER